MHPSIDITLTWCGHGLCASGDFSYMIHWDSFVFPGIWMFSLKWLCFLFILTRHLGPDVGRKFPLVKRSEQLQHSNCLFNSYCKGFFFFKKKNWLYGHYTSNLRIKCYLMGDLSELVSSSHLADPFRLSPDWWQHRPIPRHHLRPSHLSVLGQICLYTLLWVFPVILSLCCTPRGNIWWE